MCLTIKVTSGLLFSLSLDCVLTTNSYMSCVLSFVAMPGLIVGVGFRPASNEGQQVNNNYSTVSQNKAYPTYGNQQITSSRVTSYPEPDRKTTLVQKKPEINNSNSRSKPKPRPEITASTPNLTVKIDLDSILIGF